jgi:hypothetical protein
VNRLGAAGTLCVCAALALAGCGGGPDHGPPPPTTPATIATIATVATVATSTTGAAMAVIAADRPSARIAQLRRESATAVRLDIRAVANPGGQGLALAVAVEDGTDPDRHATIGNVSPYPTGQPGTFTLPLPPAAADLVHSGPTVLVVTLSPALPDTPLRPGVSLSLDASLTGA